MEEEGISLAEIWRLIMKKKIAVSLIFGIATILIFVIINFGYNNMVVNYEAKFNYRWYGIENNTYANGQIFNYYDIINKDNLSKAKSTAAEFKDVNVDELGKNIHIEINENHYILTIEGNFFANDNQARRYITALINIPYENAINLKFDFTVNLEGYQSSEKINIKLNYLEAQEQLLLRGYQGMIAYFGNVNVAEGNLQKYYEELQVFSNSQQLNQLRYLAYKNSYLSKEEFLKIQNELEALETEKNILMKRKNLLLESIKEIYESSPNNPYIDTALTTYVESLHEIDLRLTDIDEDVNLINEALGGGYQEEDSEAFLEELDEYAKTLKDYSEKYDESVKEVLRQNTFANVISFKVLNKINKSMSVIISLVLGVLTSFVVGFILGYQEEKKQKELEF